MLRSIGSTCAVEDRASGRPMAMLASKLKLSVEPDQHRQREAADQHLDEAEAEDVLAQSPQPAGVQLEPDEEQQQRDADFGDTDMIASASPIRPSTLGPMIAPATM